jgi:hypothetical protein
MSRRWILPVACLSVACAVEDGGFAGVFLAEATSAPGAPPAASDPPAGTGPRWTILVYAHGDNELSNSLLSDLTEMASAQLAPEVQLLVFADWNASRAIAGEQTRFPAGAIWYRIRGQGHPLERIEEREELDFDDPAVLTAAVAQAFRDFPAERQALVLWDHGGAWSVGFGGDRQDDTRGYAPGLATEQVAAAVRAGLHRAGLTGPRPLHFVAFDACLMGGAESITAFSDLAQVYLADAELDYGDGWDYAATLTWLSENRTATPRQLAAFEVQAWDAHHRDASLNDQLLRSHVAVDTALWPRFVSATAAVTRAARATPAPEPVALALQRSLPAYRSQVSSPRGTRLRDLGDVLGAVAAGGPRGLADAAQFALQAGRAARIAVSSGALRVGQLGVHVFGGPPLGLPAEDLQLYPRLARAWSEASGWGDLLVQLRALADSQPPGLAAAGPSVAQAGAPGSGAGLSFDVLGTDAARVEVTLLRPPGGVPTAVVVGTLASAFVQPGRYDFSWNGRLWQLPTPTGDVPMTLEPWIWQVRDGQLQAPILACQGLLESSWGETLPAALLIDGETLEASALLLDEDSRAAVHDLAAVQQADPDAVFRPVLSTVDLRTGVPSSLPAAQAVPLPPSGRLLLRQSAADPGDYRVVIRASDVWGNERAAVFPVTWTATPWTIEEGP